MTNFGYEPFAGKEVYFTNLEIPKNPRYMYGEELEYTKEMFRYQGFSLISLRNSMIKGNKTLRISSFDVEGPLSTEWNNMRKYGHCVGLVAVPYIVRYNMVDRCYYGICNYGHASEISGEVYIVKYDSSGNFGATRKIVVEDKKIVKYSGIKNELIEFLNETIQVYYKSDSYEIHRLRHAVYKAYKNNRSKAEVLFGCSLGEVTRGKSKDKIA